MTDTRTMHIFDLHSQGIMTIRAYNSLTRYFYAMEQNFMHHTLDAAMAIDWDDFNAKIPEQRSYVLKELRRIFDGAYAAKLPVD